MIRLATVDDYADIIKLSADFWLHTQFTEPFEPKHTLKMVEFSHDQEFLVVAEHDGKVIGFAAGIYSALLGNSSVLAGTELAWWIDKDHRGGRHGIMLLKFMESRAKDLGIKYWNMVAMESSMPEEVKGMYERMGYTHQESTYTKVM